MRRVPPHSHTVELYTGRLVSPTQPGQAGLGWADCAVLRKDNTEDDDKDSDGDNDNKNLGDNDFCTLPDVTRLDIGMIVGSGERDKDDHSKLLLTKNDSPEFSDIKVQTVTLNCTQNNS